MELPELMQFVKTEGITESDIDKVMGNLQMEDLIIPKTISYEGTLTEINELSKRLYQLANKNKGDAIPLNKIIALLEMKTRIVGMMNVKPEVQIMVDNDVNAYKRRFLELAVNCVDPITLDVLTDKLTAEGL